MNSRIATHKHATANARAMRDYANKEKADNNAICGKGSARSAYPIAIVVADDDINQEDEQCIDARSEAEVRNEV